MVRSHGNFHARRAAGLTSASHKRAPVLRWMVMVALALSWAYFGLKDSFRGDGAVSDAVYRTLQALTMSGGFEEAGSKRDLSGEIVRFSGIAVTAIGLLFGFSGAFGRTLARLWSLSARHHIVIAGESDAALALARSCRAARDCVILVAGRLEAETAWFLRHSGIVLIEGDPTHAEVLKSARALHAAHVVALSEDDAENLRIEAALRTLSTSVRRRKPLATHICLHAPVLLLEAREMRMQLQRTRDESPVEKPPPIDSRAFSLEEIAARSLLTNHGAEILALAARTGRKDMHFVIFGFDAAAEAVAVRTLMTFWSASFGAPRITIVTPDAATAANGFAARYPQAQAHAVWQADIQFRQFDWAGAPVSASFLDSISEARGEPCAVVISTGTDGQNIQLALALVRSANAHGVWAAPIFMHETMESDFSKQYSSDASGAMDCAYLQVFGSVTSIACRANLIDAVLDRGAAVAHRLYEKDMIRNGVDRRELEAVGRTWNDVPETYRNANRAVADSALLKLWDAGWRPATGADSPGELHPAMTPEMASVLPEIEHGRRVAERLLSGWRPGARDNRLMSHDGIVSWADLSDNERREDADQVLAAATVARAAYPKGFVPRA